MIFILYPQYGLRIEQWRVLILLVFYDDLPCIWVAAVVKIPMHCRPLRIASSACLIKSIGLANEVSP